jgi:hypothetical protein
MLRATALALREAQGNKKDVLFVSFVVSSSTSFPNGRNYVEVCRFDARSGGRRIRRPTARNAVTMGLRF